MNNDNIYNILNNFQKLTPKQEAKTEAKQPVYESVAARGSVLAGVDKIEARLKQEFSESKFGQVSKSIQKTGKSKASADAIAASIGREKLGQKEMTRRSVAGRKDEAVRVAGNTKGPVGHYSQMKYADKDGSPEAQKHRDDTAAMAKSARAAGSKLPFNKTTEPSGKLASGGYNAMTKGVTPVKMKEDTCNECGMVESDCGCEHTNENVKHTGHYGTEYYKTSDFTGDEEDKAKAKAKAKKGTGQRGRPKKADSEKSSASLPFSGKNKIGHDPFGRSSLPKSKVKGKVHRMDEAINYKRVAETHQMTLDEMIECMQRDMMQFRESGECSDLLRDCMEIYTHNKKIADEAIVKPSATDIKFATPAYQRKASGNPDWALSHDDFAQKDRETPTTKVGLAQRAKDLGISHDSDIHHELNELAKLAGIADEGNAFTGKLVDTPNGGEFELDGKKYKDTSTLDEGHCPTCDCKPCKCNEGNEFSGELAKAKMQHKDSFEVDGKTYPVKEASIPMKQTFVILDPALIDKIAEMDATEVEPDSDGKGATVSSNNPNVTAQLMSFAQKNPQRLKVTQAMAIDTKRHAGPVDNNWGKPQPTTLEDIAKLSGIAVEGRDYGNTDVEDKATARQYVNAPKEEIEDVDAIVHQGNDLNKEKQQDPKTANRAANPLTKEQTDEAFDPLEALGRRLMKEYESIKISK